MMAGVRTSPDRGQRLSYPSHLSLDELLSTEACHIEGFPNHAKETRGFATGCKRRCHRQPKISPRSKPVSLCLLQPVVQRIVSALLSGSSYARSPSGTEVVLVQASWKSLAKNSVLILAILATILVLLQLRAGSRVRHNLGTPSDCCTVSMGMCKGLQCHCSHVSGAVETVALRALMLNPLLGLSSGRIQECCKHRSYNTDCCKSGAIPQTILHSLHVRILQEGAKVPFGANMSRQLSTNIESARLDCLAL